MPWFFTGIFHPFEFPDDVAESTTFDLIETVKASFESRRFHETPTAGDRPCLPATRRRD
jgi:hypothetical protein